MAIFYKACSDIWGGCPSVKSIEGGLDSSLTEDTQSVAMAIESAPSYVPQSQPLPADDSASSLVEPDDSHHSQKTDAEPATLTQPSTSDTHRRNLIEHIQENRHSRLLKRMPVDTQLLNVAREDVALKKELIKSISEQDKENTETMRNFSATLNNLSQSISRGFTMMASMMQQLIKQSKSEERELRASRQVTYPSSSLNPLLLDFPSFVNVKQTDDDDECFD